MLVPARASSSRRTASTQGPVALTTARVRMRDLLARGRAHLDAGGRPVAHVQPDDLAARRDGRAAGRRGARDRDHEAGIVGLMVVVDAAGAQAVGSERRCQGVRAVRRDDQRGSVAEAGEGAVGNHAGPDHDRPVRPVGAQRHHEAERPHEVRRDDAGERAALGVGLAHQLDVAHPQVAEPAVDQLGGGARRPRGEVVALAQRDAQSGSRGDPGDAGPDDPSPDDDEIERVALEGLLQRVGFHLAVVARWPGICNFVSPKP